MFILQLLLLLAVSSVRTCLGKVEQSSIVKNVRDIGCSIEPMTSDIRESVGKLLNNGKRMIKFNIDIPGDTGKFFETAAENTIYRPNEWILTTDETARRLLMLLEDFVPRSFFTLSLDVGNIQLTFQQFPQNCIGHMSLNEVQSMLQHNILKNFSKENFNIAENLAVCNRQIVDQQIKYNCCGMNYENLVGGEMKCNELNEDDSVKTFMLVGNLIVYIAAIYCPLLIPSFLFKKREIKFRVKFEEMKGNRNVTCLQDEKTPLLQSMDIEEGENRKTELDILGKIITNHNKLIAEGTSYYGASKYFWDTFVILKTVSNLTIRDSETKLKDYRCFKYFSYIYRCIMIMVISLSPLVLIYMFYYMYGKSVVDYDKNISKAHDISIVTPPEIKFSFIFGPVPDMCMYIAAFLTFCVLQISSNTIKNYFFKTTHKSIKYMHMPFGQKFRNKIEKKVKDEIISKKYVLPIYIFFFFASFFPLAKVVLLQVAFHLLLKKDKKSIKGVAEIIILTVWQAFSLFLLIRYVIICTLYVVNFSVYSLLGCLLHFEDVFRYIAFIFLVSVYGYKCFNGVTEKYRKFLKLLEWSIHKKYAEHIKDTVRNKVQNSAYFVPMTGDPNYTLEVQWLKDKHVMRVKMTPSVLLFIENIDNRIVKYIPVSFFDKMISCEHDACPGKPHKLYLKALNRFCLVVLFLLYTYMVIFAMGEAHDISSGVQTLVGLGAGFLPFAFKHFIFKARKYSIMDIKSDLFWQELLNEEIENFQDSWTFENNLDNNLPIN